MEKLCEEFLKGRTNIEQILGEKNLVCEVKNCPYGNSLQIDLEGNKGYVCLSKGEIEKKSKIN